MGGGEWPFLVGGVLCLVGSVDERDANNSPAEDVFRQEYGTIAINNQYVCGRQFGFLFVSRIGCVEPVWALRRLFRVVAHFLFHRLCRHVVSNRFLLAQGVASLPWFGCGSAVAVWAFLFV